MKTEHILIGILAAMNAVAIFVALVALIVAFKAQSETKRLEYHRRNHVIKAHADDPIELDPDATSF